jgi:hypothetical protein
MIVTGKSLARRAFLRGLGVTMTLPMLDAMTPAFAASAKPPVRLGFVYVPNGVIMEKWNPKGDGADFQFAPIMKPLEPFREKLLVFSGLAQVQGRALGDGAGDHARAGATWLTGVHPKKSEINIRAGISADQIAALELSKHTQFGSLELGIESNQLAGNYDSGYSCAYTNTISWRSETTPLPVENNPRSIFEHLFGDGESTDAAARLAMLNRQRSILDYVNGSLTRLNGKLGPGDRTKLGEYTDAIRDIERRIEKADKIGKVSRINEVHVNLFAYLLDRLKATPEAGGNLLDHSLVLYGSSISNGNLHTHHDLPIVLAGGGGGEVKGNRHIVYPKDTPLNNLLLGMLEKAGAPVEKFGDSTGKLDCLS